MSDLDILIGKTITSVVVSESKDYVRFFTDTSLYDFSAEGDCCSKSWIEYIEDRENIIGSEILKIEEKRISRGEEDGYECLDIMSYDLYTNKGICKIDFRNESNGFYCGWLQLEQYWEPPEHSKSVYNS